MHATRSRPNPRWGLAAVSVGFAVLYLWVSRHGRAPIVLADEAGYLGNARYLVGHTGMAPTVVEYLPGYSLFLAPAALLAHRLTSFYRLAVVTNCLLAATLPALLYLLLPRLVRGIDGWRRLLAASVPGFYAAVMVTTAHALPENLFVPAFAACCVLGSRAFERPTAGRAAAFGAGAGLLTVIHGRGVAVAIAAAVVALRWTAGRWMEAPATAASDPGRDRERARAGAACLAAIAVAYAAGVVFRRLFPRHPAFPTPKPPGMRAIVSRNLHGELLHRLPGVVAGQGLYLAVGTGALFLLGLWVLFGHGALAWLVGRARRDADDGPAGQLAAFVLLATAGVWALSALYINGGPRLDQIIYGRYNEGVLAVLLAAGAAKVLTNADPLRIRLWGLGAAAAAIVVFALAVHWFAPVKLTVVGATNVYAVFPYIRHGSLHLLGLTAAGVAAAALVWLTPARTGAAVLAVISVAFVATAFADEADYVRPTNDAVLRTLEVARSVEWLNRRVGVRCLSYERDRTSEYNLFTDVVALPKVRFDVVANPDEAPWCDGLLLSRRLDLDAQPAHAGARVVGMEVDGLALWAQPGPRLDAAVSGGHVLGRSVDGFRLPAEAQAGRVDTRSATASARRGGSVAVSVENTGTGAGWAPGALVHAAAGSVRVEAALLSADGAQVAALIGDLPKAVFPGDRADVALVVPPTVPPGTYRLRVGLVQLGVGPFPAASAPPRELSLVVR